MPTQKLWGTVFPSQTHADERPNRRREEPSRRVRDPLVRGRNRTKRVGTVSFETDTGAIRVIHHQKEIPRLALS